MLGGCIHGFSVSDETLMDLCGTGEGLDGAFG